MTPVGALHCHIARSKDVITMLLISFALVMIMIMRMIMFVAFLVSVGGILISQLKKEKRIT